MKNKRFKNNAKLTATEILRELLTTERNFIVQEIQQHLLKSRTGKKLLDRFNKVSRDLENLK